MINPSVHPTRDLKLGSAGPARRLKVGHQKAGRRYIRALPACRSAAFKTGSQTRRASATSPFRALMMFLPSERCWWEVLEHGGYRSLTKPARQFAPCALVPSTRVPKVDAPCVMARLALTYLHKRLYLKQVLAVVVSDRDHKLSPVGGKGFSNHVESGARRFCTPHHHTWQQDPIGIELGHSVLEDIEKEAGHSPQNAGQGRTVAA